MATQVIMPQLGESVVEGTITKWLKAVGEPVEEYEALLEVNTDKVDTEVPSPASGVLLATLALEGAVVQAGTVLAWIGATGEKLPGGEAFPDGDSQAGAAGLLSVVAEQATLQPGDQQRSPVGYESQDLQDLGFISPLVRRIAAEYAVDLHQVHGSGEGGRITKKDVLAYIDRVRIGKPVPTSGPSSLPSEPTIITPSSATPGDVILV